MFLIRLVNNNWVAEGNGLILYHTYIAVNCPPCSPVTL